MFNDHHPGETAPNALEVAHRSVEVDGVSVFYREAGSVAAPDLPGFGFTQVPANTNAEVRFYDTGHFALETHASPIAADLREFLARALPTQAGAE
jgi:pimeloyl-ACP methyl ester carboxylesterase